MYLDTYAPRRTGARCLPKIGGGSRRLGEGLGVIRAYRHADLLQIGVLEFTKGGRLASLIFLGVGNYLLLLRHGLPSARSAAMIFRSDSTSFALSSRSALASSLSAAINSGSSFR